MNFRPYVALVVLLVCAAPQAVAEEAISKAFASAGGMVDSATERAQDAALSVLYQRLFAFRDKKIRKQYGVEMYQSYYRSQMDLLKARFPDSSEEEILKAALAGPNLVYEYTELVSWYRGLNSALREMAEIDAEIIFVEEKIAQYLSSPRGA